MVNIKVSVPNKLSDPSMMAATQAFWLKLWKDTQTKFWKALAANPKDPKVQALWTQCNDLKLIVSTVSV